jgi:hypothetical protein
MQNAKRNLLNNDLMIKPILTCTTGMSNTDFIPATPRIVASVIVCSFAFYCYVCIYEHTMTEATIRGVAGMKSVLDMPVVQVRIGLIIKSLFNKFLFAFCIFRCAYFL